MNKGASMSLNCLIKQGKQKEKVRSMYIISSLNKSYWRKDKCWRKFIQVWNYLRVSKWWHDFHFGVNNPFKTLGVWTYTDLTVRLCTNAQFSIWLQIQFCQYKQSDIWTEPLISSAQRKHASWMYQTSNKTKSGHRRQQEHLEQIHKSKYYAYFACLSLLTHLIQIA